MPNVVKYQSGGSETHSIKKGNLWFGVGGRGYGPTDTTGFYSGIEIPDGGYAFYQGSADGFTYYTANNDDQLVALVNSATGNSFNISESLHYIAQQDGMAVMKKNENQIVTDGLVFNVEASSLLSYPTTESKWYDLSGENNDGALTNGPIFNPVGYFEFDGVDDYVSFSQITFDDTTFTTEALIKITDFDTRRIIFGGSRFFEFTSAGTILMKFNADGTSTFINLGGHPSSSTLNKTFLHHLVKKPGNVYESYVNGELVITKTPPFTAYPEINITSDTSIEHYYTSLGNNGSRDFYGNFYSAKVYNRNLSQSEILQNYYGGPIVTDDLAFYFDPGNLVSYESGSTTAYSMTGSYTGTLINDVELDPQKGGVWKFDAVDTAISYGYQVINFNPSTQPFSMGGWMRLDSDSGSGNHAVIIDIGGTSSARLYIAIDKNDLRLVVNIRPPAGTTSVPVYTPENSVSFGEWVHGMVTFNGGTIKIYQNGELSRTATGFTNYPTATYNWWSGHQDDNNHYMDGFIGPVSLYLKTLSDDEVWQNYLAQSIRFK
jgi:hypothetical protein